MARIVLLNPPGQQLYLRDQYCSSTSKASYYWPPIDLLVISGRLSQDNDLLVIDATIEQLTDEACLTRLASFQPQIVVFVTGVASWLSDFSFVAEAKARTGAKVVASGGFLLTQWPDVMAKTPWLDAVLLDYSSTGIADYAAGRHDQVVDMVTRQPDGCLAHRQGNAQPVVNIPVPRHDLFPLRHYRLPHGRLHPFGCLQTNFGCPYQCCFCVAEHMAFRYRPVDNIMEEVHALWDLGIRELFIRDFTFGIPRDAAETLCLRMSQELPGLSWVCSSRANCLDDTLLNLMRRAGCHTIQFGVESGSQELLDDNNKQITLEQIRRTFATCRRLDIKTLGHFILGLPRETEATLQATIRLAREIDCDYAFFNVAIPIPGSSLRQHCLDNGWLVGENEELDCSRGYPVIETPWLSRQRLWQARNQAIRAFYLRPGYVLKRLLGVRSLHQLQTLCREGFSLLANLWQP